MDVEFVIPLKKDDLLKGGLNQYVANLHSSIDCFKRLKDLNVAITQEGCDIVSTEFDTVFSILYDSSDLSFYQLQELFDKVIIKLIALVIPYTENALKNSTTASNAKTVNILKMVFYLFSLHIRTYEEKITSKADNFIGDVKRGKGRTKQKNNDDNSWDWNDKKLKAFFSVYAFLQLDIAKLWQPPIVEEQFINLIANCCYKIYENPEIAQAKGKPLKDSLAQILAVLILHYNHGLTFIPKIVVLMKQHEHMASVMSSAVLIMIREYNCNTLLPKVLRELGDSVQEEEVPALAKAASTFITDIAEAEPQLMLPTVKTLIRYLGTDVYSIRIAILVAFSELLINCLSEENITEEFRQVRDRLLKALHNHIRDQSAHVRSKVLQLWTKLASIHAIPKSKLLPILKAIKFHITDKGCYVAKNAIHFFKVILENNPYAGRLNLADLKEKHEKEMKVLISLEPQKSVDREDSWKVIEADLVLQITNEVSKDDSELEADEDESAADVTVNDVMIIIYNLMKRGCYVHAYKLLRKCEVQFPKAKEIRCNIDFEDKGEYYIAALKKVFMISEDIPLHHVTKVADGSVQEYEKQKAIVEYIEECMSFVNCINEASSKIYDMMFSKTYTEVLEAIEYFTVASQFDIKDSKKAVKDMLNLVKSQQQNIREAVATAYKTLYLTSNKPSAKARAYQTANRLIDLLKSLSMEEKRGLEDLIQFWIQKNELDKEFLMVLWSKVLNKSPEVSIEDSRAALILLDSVANINYSMVQSNIGLLVAEGFEENPNLHKVQYTCNIIAKQTSTKVDGKFVRYSFENKLFKQSLNVVIENFNKTNISGYSNMATSVINMIFQVSTKPEKLADSLINTLYTIMMNENSENDLSKGDVPVKEEMLLRLFYIYGHVVFRIWQYFDRDVYNRIKRCQDGQEISKPAGDEEEDEFEADNAVAADDALYDLINEMIEEMFKENTLFGHIKDLVLKICRGLEEPVSPKLKSAAAATLAKLMIVSQTLCENHIQLYVTLMERSKDEAVRANLVLGFGDLTCRFPNTVEPWTTHLYGRLKETSVIVKKNTVTVLTQLITREMVKVRGQIAELALCLLDNEPTIAENVKFLMMDLSQKGNTLYNVVPDIISMLSNPERPDPISSENFNIILKHILGLVTKERQNELLVEKLCARLREATNERQFQDLAFCLSQLSYNDKSLRRLVECIPTFSDKLANYNVYSALNSIFNTAQKSTKPNLKEIAIEGHEKLEEQLATNSDKEEDGTNRSYATPIKVRRSSTTPMKNAARSVTKSVRKSTKKLPARPKRGKAGANWQSDSDSESENFREKRPVRQTRVCPIKEVSDSDEG